MEKIKQSQVEEYIGNRLPFRTASASASNNVYGIPKGQLNDEEYAPLLGLALEGRISYVVFSYETPVAWVLDGKPHVTDQIFSHTTSQLQALCRRALP